MLLDCKYPLFVGGYGSGKTFTLIASALRDLFMWPGARVAIYSDTYDQLRLNIAPRLEEVLEEAGIPYTFNKSEWTIDIPFGNAVNSIIMRSIDNPKRIIGYEVFRSHVDEIEAATNEKKAEDVWRKIMARNRQKCGDLQNRVSAYTTADQGFGFTYKKWGKAKNGEYQYVKAPTSSNPHLPPDYVEALRADYTAELAEAFLEGSWCNLTSGSVYPYFDRKRNHTDATVKPGEPLHIGMDFNVRNMAAVVHNEDGDAIAEHVGYADTPAMIAMLKERYVGHRLFIYPDASGQNASSKGAALTDIKLLKDAGFTVKARPRNPRVRDRVLTVNKRFENGAKVNTKTCPQLTEALEKQTYDQNGEPDKSAGYDHIMDAKGYHDCYRFPIRRIETREIWV